VHIHPSGDKGRRDFPVDREEWEGRGPGNASVQCLVTMCGRRTGETGEFPVSAHIMYIKGGVMGGATHRNPPIRVLTQKQTTGGAQSPEKRGGEAGGSDENY